MIQNISPFYTRIEIEEVQIILDDFDCLSGKEGQIRHLLINNDNKILLKFIENFHLSLLADVMDVMSNQKVNQENIISWEGMRTKEYGAIIFIKKEKTLT